MKKVLFVAAHPDDIESSCSGTIIKCGESIEGYIVVFAPCLDDPLNAGILEEFKQAQALLGIKNLIVKNFRNQLLEQYSQQIRDILYEFRTTVKPEVVFCPSLNDLHQDHKAVAKACMTIFRDCTTLLAYEIVRSTVNFNPTLFVQLSKEIMEKKLDVLRCYKTQYRRTYFKPRIFRALATFRGSQINCEYAEAFEVLRMINL